MSKLVEANEKIAENVVSGYKKMESGIVNGYTRMQDSIVNGANKVMDKCTEKLLSKEGESIEETKARLNARKPEQMK